MTSVITPPGPTAADRRGILDVLLDSALLIAEAHTQPLRRGTRERIHAEVVDAVTPLLERLTVRLAEGIDGPDARDIACTRTELETHRVNRQLAVAMLYRGVQAEADARHWERRWAGAVAQARREHARAEDIARTYRVRGRHQTPDGRTLLPGRERALIEGLAQGRQLAQISSQLQLGIKTTSRLAGQVARRLHCRPAHPAIVTAAYRAGILTDQLPAPAAPGPLTDQLVEILAEVAEGYTSREIGRRLGLTKTAVDDHARRACAQLRAHTRAHAVALAIQRGDLTVPGTDGSDAA